MKVLVRGPALTRTGYGEHCRFVLRALRSVQDLDIYLMPVNWGQSAWVWEDSEERYWIDEIVKKTAVYNQQKGKYDVSVQVTIPNEWQKLARVNVGVTAGIESTKVAPLWLQKCNEMDKVVTISEHARQGFLNTVYEAVEQKTGEKFILKCDKDISIAGYPVKEQYLNKQLPELDLQLSTKFNFLTVAQWGPRKNLPSTIKWFVEEFIDNPNVGLVVKAFLRGGCVLDKISISAELKKLLSQYDNRKCKVYLLHGDLNEEEMHSLYVHKDIHALISLTHGEGFGLPIFEAAYSGLPILATDWSGHLDFLYKPTKDKKGKEKLRPHFAKVDYDIQPIPKDAIWEGVLQKESMWAYPKQGSYKMKLREVYKDHSRFKSQAKKLQSWIRKNFEEHKQYDKLVKSMGFEILPSQEEVDYVFVSDIFSEQYAGGAELSLQALIDSCGSDKYIKFNSQNLTKGHLSKYSKSQWIFGNIQKLDEQIIELLADSKNIRYNFIEFDYKFCEYRNPVLYEFLEDEKCDYKETKRANLIDRFAKNAKNVFFMSEDQKKVYQECLGGYEDPKNVILSSVFDDSFFKKIKDLRKSKEYKNKKGWIVLGSRSWVKGAAESEKWCRENDLDYEVVFGVEYDEMLKKLAGAEGICFKIGLIQKM